MKQPDGRKYRHYHHLIDLDAFEAAIGFEPLRQATNKRGEIEDIGHCPDPWSLHKHGDTTGKFAINRNKRVYNCFVCGGGTLFDLAMAINALDETRAEEWLFEFTAPSETSDGDFLSEIDAILHQERVANPPMPYYNEHVLDKWTKDLIHIESWLQERGISEETATRARVGFQADAIRHAPASSAKQSYTGPCVYLPHFWGERLVGWQQRWLDDDRPKWISKYTNTSSFPKTETIYNYENVYLAQQPIVVCESTPTVLFLTSIGYPAVGTFGASVSEEQMRLLRLFNQGLALAPDNDGPGRSWLDYTPAEQRLRNEGRRIERVILADYLSQYVPVQIIEPVGEYDSGDDLADLMHLGAQQARKSVDRLYRETSYY